MYNWELMLAEVKQQDLQRELAQRRLSGLAQAAQPRQTRQHTRLLAWFGRRLVAWGWRLQGAHFRSEVEHS